MGGHEKFIGVRELGKLFGWSPARLKKELHYHGICHKDGTPAKEWTSIVIPKFITCHYSGEMVVKYLWPKEKILETLSRLGYEKIKIERLKLRINSWYNIEKPMDTLTAIAYEKVKLSDREAIRLHAKTINCNRLSNHWMTISRRNRRLVGIQLQEVYEDFLKTKLGRKTLKKIVCEDKRYEDSVLELSDFLKRQRYKKLSKDVLSWLK